MSTYRMVEVEGLLPGLTVKGAFRRLPNGTPRLRFVLPEGQSHDFGTRLTIGGKAYRVLGTKPEGERVWCVDLEAT